MRSAGVWPFLIARGRRRGYTTVLAPDFLVDDRTHGLLSRVRSASPDAVAAAVDRIDIPRGKPLTVVHGSHLVTASDLDEASPAAAGDPPRDEHGRPLRIVYGLVCTASKIPAKPPREDLAAALGYALDVYREFLGSEDDFTVAAAPRFADWDLSETSAPATRTGLAADGMPAEPRNRGNQDNRSNRRRLALAGAVTLAAVGAVTWWALSETDNGTTPPCPSASSPSSTQSPAKHAPKDDTDDKNKKKDGKGDKATDAPPANTCPSPSAAESVQERAHG